MEISLILKFLISFAIGALIGTERERKQLKIKEFAGIRTFMLIAVFGTSSAFLSTFYPNFIVIAFLGFTAMIGLSYIATTRENEDIGITTEVTAFLTFILGALCFTDEGVQIVPILAIIITTLLAVKPYLHKFARKISQKELINTLKFLIIAFVILPLLPDQTFGPLNVFNPNQIWLMVVFISGISFAGYVLMKFVGAERGISATGIVGGLVSSTAVVTAMAARVKESEFVLRAAVFAAVVASSMMFLRVLFEVVVVNPSLIGLLVAPMLIMGILGIALGFIAWKTTNVKEIKADVKLKNPFSLKPALIFGGLFLAILFASKIADIYFGSRGLYITSIISGVADVDAITISMAILARDTISPDVAVTAITLAAISNTVIKFLIAMFFGTRKFGYLIGVIFAIIIGAGLLAVFFV
ncbi:MgtC/SapB family protein [Methanobacterium sp. ACI-7]|uniref:MgtC/SapB family protein n=1 Tax=unclassified Methanobacterium TaxID=2627676 RepID=UPI0039C24295